MEEFQKIAKDIEIPANFIIVDKKNIGYQQSGNLPKRSIKNRKFYFKL